ncbi:WD40 repeat domain-containing protein [Nonomuraea sp. B1E8]|uniref:WD40 repeat domain-containing protein n=1 Tax=unclassified Nonomuraea TaxID=2593643 RepID=UPI00325D4D4E
MIDSLDPAGGLAAALAALRATDWSRYDPARDTVTLRDALAELERVHGVTEAHRFATARIRAAGAWLRHPDVHHGELNGYALSPCGRYLAVGSGTGENYDAGGVLQIFEVATGRCVNAIDGIAGGVGFPDYTRSLQWSADGTRIALEFNTNATGVWDPFGAGNKPIADAYFFGGGRPLGMALAPDGMRALVYGGESDFMWQVIVSMEQGPVSGPPDGEETGPEPLEFTGPLPGAYEDEWGEEPELLLHRIFWSRDGSRIYGEMRGGWIVCLNADERKVVWILETGADHNGDPLEWSLDDRLLAYQHDGKLVIADAGTGQTLTERPAHAEAEFLRWGPEGRLAVVTSDRVTVLDGTTGERLHDLDIGVHRAHPRGWDPLPWAWSPDGRSAALVNGEGRVEIWELGGLPERLRVIDGLYPETGGHLPYFGLEWTPDNVLVMVGGEAVRFVRAETGEIIGDFAFHHEPVVPRPFELDGRDRFPEATLALDADTWAAAFEDGTVIVPPGREGDLSRLLAWTIDRRFAWPAHWGDLEVHPDAASAAEHIGGPFEPFRGRGAPPLTPGTWPPPNTATIDDLIRAMRAATAHPERYDEALQQAAMIWLRRGEAAAARDLAAMIPESDRRPFHAAKLAVALGAAGHRSEAAAIFHYDDSALADAEQEPGFATVVAAACELLGRRVEAVRWKARAREDEGWTARLWHVWTLLERRRDDEARALLDAGEDVPTSPFEVNPWLAYLLRTGRTQLVRELLINSRGAFPSRLRWFDTHDAAEIIAALGEEDLLRLWGDVHRSVDDLLSPNEQTGDQLATAHAALRDVPRAQRDRALGDLTLQAAAHGNVSAVLSLLSQLQDPHRHALSALRIITTGTDIEVW